MRLRMMTAHMSGGALCLQAVVVAVPCPLEYPSMNTMNLDPRKNLTPEALTPPHRPLPERLRNDPVLALIREEVPKRHGEKP
jgi:hypothetical protein